MPEQTSDEKLVVALNNVSAIVPAIEHLKNSIDKLTEALRAETAARQSDQTK